MNQSAMKILVVGMFLVLGAAAWPDRRGSGPRDGPPHPHLGRPLPPRGERPPFRPAGGLPPFDKGPMGGAGAEDWIPPFNAPGFEFGMEDGVGMGPTGRLPCPPKRPGRPNGGETGPDTESEGPTVSPDEGNRGDRILSKTPGSDRPRERRDRPRGQGPRPDRPQRGGRRRRPQGEEAPEEPRRGRPGVRRIKPFKGKRLNPEDMEKREFFPIFSAANVTIENADDIPLMEGDNAYLLPVGPRRVKLNKAGENAPQEQFGGIGYGYGYGSGGFLPYLNIKYNPSSTPTVSFEYGITQFLG